MKKKHIVKVLLPLAGFILTSCETSGQLLTVDSGMGVAAGAVAVGIVASIASKLQQKQALS